MICQICRRECRNNKSLGTHVWNKHKLHSKDYYDKFLKTEEDGICKRVGCNNATKFRDGKYRNYCSCKCAQNSGAREKFEQTMEIKYNVKYPAQVKQFRDKMIQSWAEKDKQQLEEIMRKRENTMMKKYGVNHNTRTEEHRKKMKSGYAAYMNKFIKNPSKQELQLREMVLNLYPEAQPQYKILNYSIDIGILEYKIAIEFDGWYHFDCQHDIDYHKKRQEEIEKEGWKFIRYNIFQKFPTKEQVKENICSLIL